MHATDIVAYTYQAETLCPSCTINALGFTAPSYHLSVETTLDTAAIAAGINRYDECEFDTNDFPKVVFASQIEDAENCGQCGESLV